MSDGREQIPLRINGTANGDGAEVTISRSGIYRFSAGGTWDGATESLYAKPIGLEYSLYEDADSGSIASLAGTGTRNLSISVALSAGDKVKPLLSGVGASTSISSSLSRIEVE